MNHPPILPEYPEQNDLSQTEFDHQRERIAKLRDGIAEIARMQINDPEGNPEVIDQCGKLLAEI
ncbi:hypothetical protein [Vibrio quintilis]|uniref:Uncharacterized protein n=1 Tax=Vibrio quintilis TaxID=1117707 RepID=A0A1M7YP42_9VIBR|nr:hypothetical protein [Vibrio quintilis]SHO54369.1 hypothetical protein VQ7734_00083 [Vibrio quintilis]